MSCFDDRAKLLISGDVIFKGGVGRSDFPRGDHNQLISSIKDKLLPLGDDVTFIPGHGPLSTLGYERLHNPLPARRNARLVKAHKKPAFKRASSVLTLTALPQSLRTAAPVIWCHPGHVYATRSNSITPNSSPDAALVLCQATEGEHAVLFDDKAEVAICAFFLQRIDEQLTHTLEYAGAYQSVLVPKSHVTHRCSGWWQQQKRRCAGGLE